MLIQLLATTTWYNLVINPKDPTEAFALSEHNGVLVRIDLAAGTFTKVSNSNTGSVVGERWRNLVINPKDPTEAFALSNGTWTVIRIDLKQFSVHKDLHYVVQYKYNGIKLWSGDINNMPATTDPSLIPSTFTAYKEEALSATPQGFKFIEKHSINHLELKKTNNLSGKYTGINQVIQDHFIVNESEKATFDYKTRFSDFRVATHLELNDKTDTDMSLVSSKNIDKSKSLVDGTLFDPSWVVANHHYYILNMGKGLKAYTTFDKAFEQLKTLLTTRTVQKEEFTYASHWKEAIKPHSYSLNSLLEYIKQNLIANTEEMASSFEYTLSLSFGGKDYVASSSIRRLEVNKPTHNPLESDIARITWINGQHPSVYNPINARDVDPKIAGIEEVWV